MKTATSQIPGASLRRQRLLIDLAGVAVCIAMLAAGYVTALGPLLHHKAQVVASTHALALQHQKVQNAQQTLRKLKQEMAGLQSFQDQDVLQSGKLVRINTRLGQITSMAAIRGLEVKGVEPGALRQEPHDQVMPLRLTGTGSFRGCMSFLHDLRQSMHDTTVAGFRLSGTPGAAGVPINFNLDLCWYTAPLVASAQEER
jgi:Tfp pilus assembly protein PilO